MSKPTNSEIKKAVDTIARAIPGNHGIWVSIRSSEDGTPKICSKITVDNELSMYPREIGPAIKAIELLETGR